LDIFCQKRGDESLPTLDYADALRCLLRVGVLLRGQK
jgi:hypothetical protein